MKTMEIKYHQQATEIISIGQPSIKGPDLPQAVYHHCLISVNDSVTLITGGWIGGSTDYCHYMSVEGHYWYQGPDLITDRYWHGCGRFKSAAHQGRTVFIVSGGYNSYGLVNSTEILDPSTGQWMFLLMTAQCS
jgi:hypothetical protein